MDSPFRKFLKEEIREIEGNESLADVKIKRRKGLLISRNYGRGRRVGIEI